MVGGGATEQQIGSWGQKQAMRNMKVYEEVTCGKSRIRLVNTRCKGTYLADVLKDTGCSSFEQVVFHFQAQGAFQDTTKEDIDQLVLEYRARVQKMHQSDVLYAWANRQLMTTNRGEAKEEDLVSQAWHSNTRNVEAVRQVLFLPDIQLLLRQRQLTCVWRRTNKYVFYPDGHEDHHHDGRDSTEKNSSRKRRAEEQQVGGANHSKKRPKKEQPPPPPPALQQQCWWPFLTEQGPRAFFDSQLQPLDEQPPR